MKSARKTDILEDGSKKRKNINKQPKLFGALLEAVYERYLIPERLIPKKMFVAAVRRIESRVPSLMVNRNVDKLSLKVGGRFLEIPLRDVERLESMDRWAFRVAAFVLRTAGESITAVELQQNMFAAMLETTDPHSGYFSPNRFRGIQEMLLGEAAGIGVDLHEQKGFPVVRRVYPGSPAEKRGLKNGDVIMKVGGLSVMNLPISRVQKVLRGTKGSRIEVLVGREGWKRPRIIRMIRDDLEIPSVETRYIDGGVGLFRISDFKVNTPKLLRREIERLRKKGLKSVVLDLRNNWGGIVGSVTAVADLFVDTGLLLKSVGKNGKAIKRWEAQEATTVFRGRVVVLVDGKTVSAGEILAGSLKSLNRGIVIGARTWGKGTAQEIFHTSDGGAYKITTFQFRVADDRPLHLAGVVPHVILKPIGKTESGLQAFHVTRRDDEAHRWMGYKDGVSPETMLEEKRGEPIGVLNFLRLDGKDRVLELAAGLAKDLSQTKKEESPEDIVAEWFGRVKTREKSRIESFFASLGVDWTMDESSSVQKRLDGGFSGDGGVGLGGTEGETIKLGLYTEKDTVKAGEILKLTLAITNQGSRKLNRCGGVLRSTKPWLDGREFVVGDVPSGKSRQSVVEIRVPFDVVTHSFGLEMELIVSGRTTGVELSRSLEVREIPRPVFSYSVQLNDLKEGNGNGILEQGERGELFLNIKNSGGTATEVRVDTVEAADPVLVTRPRVKLGKIGAGDIESAVIPVEFSRRENKGMVPEYGKVSLVVYDRLLGGHVRGEVKIPSGLKSFSCKSISATGTPIGRAYLRGAAEERSPIIAKLYEGGRLNINARCGAWYRLSLEDGRGAFINKNEVSKFEKSGANGKGIDEDEKNQHDGGREKRGHHSGDRGGKEKKTREYEPVFSVSPPEIKVERVEVGRMDRFKVKSTVSHKSGVRDVWVVTWSLDEAPMRRGIKDKVFYRSLLGNQKENGLNANSVSRRKTFSFEAEVPAKTGTQIVGVVARNGEGVQAVESLSVFRRDEPLQHEAVVGRTGSGGFISGTDKNLKRELSPERRSGCGGCGSCGSCGIAGCRLSDGSPRGSDFTWVIVLFGLFFCRFKRSKGSTPRAQP